MEQTFLHIPCSTVSLTSFRTGAVPDRQSPGWFPTSPGITGLRLFVPSWPVRSDRALRECQYCPNWLPPMESPTTSAIRRPDTPEPLSLHIHSQSRVHKYVRGFTVQLLYTSRLSPYCCSYLDVRDFTVLLFYS